MVEGATLTIGVMETELEDGVSAAVPDDLGRRDVAEVVVETQGDRNGNLDIFEHSLIYTRRKGEVKRDKKAPLA